MNIQIENSSLIRDLNSKAVLSTDKTAFDKYLKQKEEKERINRLERDVNEIKSMLELILSKIEK